MSHVAIVGAGGKVAKEMLNHLLRHNEDETLKLSLIAHKTDRIKGALLDTRDALYLCANADISGRKDPLVQISDDLAQTRYADLVIVLASKWPSVQLQQQFADRDNTGRLVLSYVNHDMVVEISKAIKQFAPDAMVIMVTNQSDIMTLVAREFLQPEKVIGFGGLIDTARFCRALSEKLTNPGHCPPSNEVKGYVIGYHNNDMMALSESISTGKLKNASAEQIDDAVGEARMGGPLVTGLQKKSSYIELNTGPTVLPGVALYHCIMAFTGQHPAFVGSFNVVLPTQEIAGHFGLISKDCLSVPIECGRAGYSVCLNYRVNHQEQSHLYKARDRLMEEYQQLKAALAPPNPTPRGSVRAAI
jgi:malate/lactate dehydrogenase